MKNDIEAIKTAVTRLRADLMATNLTIDALSSVLTPEQQRQVLKALSELSVMQEQTAEKAQMPEVIALLQQSIQRMYSSLEGTAKMRQAKLDGLEPME